MSPGPPRRETRSHRVTLHGVFLSILGQGVLIAGGSGIGKGRLALELVSRGHALVCDDAPEFLAGGLVGSAPPELGKFLMVRGLGVVNVCRTFGNRAVMARESLRLIVELTREPAPAHDVEPPYTFRTVLGQRVPTVPLSLMGSFNPALLLETLVRTHILRGQGYRACNDFAECQRRMMDGQA